MSETRAVKGFFAMLSMLLLAGTLGCGGGAGGARKALPSEYPSTQRQWYDDTIDQVEFLERFSLGDYSRVVVLPLDTSKVLLPPSTDNTYKPAVRALAQSTGTFVTGIKTELKDYPVTMGSSAEPPAEKVVALRASIVEMNPGSAAQRFWVGGGAGAAGTRIQAELVDAQSGKTLLRFDDRRTAYRRGSYDELLKTTTTELGEDAGLLLSAFTPAKKKGR